MKLDLEKRAERLCRRLENGKASIENERSAHESAVIAIKAKVSPPRVVALVTLGSGEPAVNYSQRRWSAAFE